VAVALERRGLRFELEETVQRRRLHPGRLAHPLRRAARRRREANLEASAGKDREDRPDDRRLAHARTSGDDEHLARGRLLDGATLLGGELDARSRFEGHDSFANALKRGCRSPRDQAEAL